MSEKRFTYENNKVYDNLTGEFHSSNMVSVNVLNELNDENEQLRQALKDTEEEKEHYADLYNECRRLKLSNEAIRKAYAELNRKEREKHSQGNTTYTRKSDLEVMY